MLLPTSSITGPADYFMAPTKRAIQGEVLAVVQPMAHGGVALCSCRTGQKAWHSCRGANQC